MGFDKTRLMNSVRIKSHSPVRIWNNFNLLRSLIRGTLSIEFVWVLAFFSLFLFIFCLLVKMLGLDEGREDFFFSSLLFFFKFAFISGPTTESKPGCYPGFRNTCQSWGTCSPEPVCAQQLTEALAETHYSQLWQSLESLCMSTAVPRSRLTETSPAVCKMMSSHSSSLPSCW